MNLRVEQDETVIAISCAGGGYGPPVDRAPARVKHDVDEGYVSKARAETIYRVVFDERQAVDVIATARLRAPRPDNGALL